MANEQQTSQLRQLRSLSILLDSQFKGPFGFKFGLDGLLGLIPVFGDIATAGASLYIITQATNLGASPAVILRMILNVALENVIAVVPLIGNIFDFFWKSNNKNMALLEAHLLNPQGTRARSRVFNVFFLIVVIFFMVASIMAAYFILYSLLHWANQLYRGETTSGSWM
jgi:hypothetical protein